MRVCLVERILFIDPDTGLLEGARFLPSPNCDERPSASVPELVVVHNISLPPGRFGTGDVERLFLNRLDTTAREEYRDLEGLHVSAHLLIERDGRILQFVPFHRRAWHAGRSRWRGRERCNDFSVGIELEGTDTTPYTPVQYRRLAEAVRALERAYPGIRPDALAGHQDIAPGRKTDPGPAFDWDYLQALVEAGDDGGAHARA